MTADAKVGLLLGLFFIVIIAFLVNGLPNFIQKEKTSPPNAAIVTPPSGKDIILGDSLPKAVHRLYPSRIEKQEAQQVQETIVLDSSSSEQLTKVETPTLVHQSQETAVVVNPTEKVQKSVKTPDVKTHIVKSGENLPVIAKLYYGQEEGNRHVVIQKLYEANKNVLKSPDQVNVGDKLIIPALGTMLDPSAGVVKAPNPTQGLLQKFSGILEKVDEKEAASISEYSEYTVQEGDSLWAIAQQTLGDGNRYSEIVKLNKDKIKNASEVAVGTRLKIPTQ